THILGFNGSEEISGAGTAYLLAKALDSRNVDLSPMAIVGALGDQQDKAAKRGFKGLNSEILKDAVDSRLIEVKQDLIFFGRQTRPVHRAIASTTDTSLRDGRQAANLLNARGRLNLPALGIALGVGDRGDS